MKTPQKQKSRTKKKEINIKVVSILLSIFSVVFVIGGALGIYYFSKGYRLNIPDRQIKRTGVLTVQSEPSNAQVYINGDDVGRTPKSRTLDVGIHNISVKKDGYVEWNKEVEIVEEKSTPIYPFLVLEELIPSNIWRSEGTVEKYWINEDKDYFIFLLADPQKQYSLWTYRINAPIWNLNPNPVQILSFETNEVELKISNNGLLAIMTVTENEEQSVYVIELNSPTSLDNLKPIEQLASSEYEIYWSKDNRHIIMESTDEIVSLDTSNLGSQPLNPTSTLVEKEPDTKYLWSTDEEGFFYVLEELHTQEDETYIYALKQFQPDGTNPKYTIEKVYFQKNRDFIQYYRENGDSYPEFTNSPQSTQTIGEIVSFEVNQTTNGVYISTDTSTYWYDISKDKYRMICAHPAELISFSPDSRRLLFANGNYIYVFTLKKEEGDHTDQIETEKVVGLKKDNVSNIAWLSNSTHIHYIEDNTLYLTEKDGDNKTELIEIDNVLIHSIKTNREHLVTLETKEDTLFINQYKIK